MAITAAAIQATVSISGADKAKSDLQGVSDKVKSTSDGLLGLAGGVALAAGAAFVGIGVASTKMAADFESGITSLKTGAGEAQDNLKMVSDGVLKMAVDTGTSAKMLTDGMYMIESAGFHGADGLKVLQSAAEGAKVGNADLASVANGVTTALTDYALPASKATEVTNTLVATVAAGKTHMADLASAMSTILPTASSVGVGLTDVSAAMATMTGQGTDAASASTYLRQLLMALENPAKKGADALKSVGLSAQQVSDGMKKSLPDTLAMITDAVGKKFPVGSAAYVGALAEISGGSRQMQGMLELTGTHLETFGGNVKSITDAVNKGGNAITGWSDVQGTFNFKMDKAKEVVETVGIKIGEKLLPTLGKLMDGFSSPAFEKFATTMGDDLGNALEKTVNTISDTVKAVTRMVDFFQKNNGALDTAKVVVLALAGAIGGALTFSLYTAATAAWAALAPWLVAAAPFIAVGAVIGVVVAGIVLAIQHWGDITGWITGKTDQMRISVEQSHNKMALSMANSAAKGAGDVLYSLDQERLGIIQKLKNTNDEVEKADLTHQLTMVNQQEIAEQKKFHSALADQKKQLDIQKDLQSQMEEAQKPWLQRMGDGIMYGFQAAWHWISDRAVDAWHAIQTAFAPVGGWFNDRWHDVQNWWGGAGQWFNNLGSSIMKGISDTVGGVGKWFQDRFNEAYKFVTGIFGGIGKWFADRWNEIYETNKPLITFIGQVFQTIWNIIVALFGKLGAWFNSVWQDVVKVFTPAVNFFHDIFTSAYNAVSATFSSWGAWWQEKWKQVTDALGATGGYFHDRFTEAWNAVTSTLASWGSWWQTKWQQIKDAFAATGGYFHDRFTEAWNKIVEVFTPLGNWFRDRWNDVMNGINTFKNSVVDKFNELKTDASNIFHGLINGIVDQLNNGISAVEGFINGIGQGLDSIAKALGTTGTIEVVHIGRIPHYASGTDSHPGGPAMVGERGPEMVFLPKGTKVAPHDKTNQLLAGGKVPGYAGGIGDIASSIMGWIGGGAKSILDNVMNAMNIHLTLPSGLGNIATGLVNKVKDWAVSWIEKILPKFGGLGPDGTPVNIPGNLQSWIAQAMGLAGAPASWANDLGIIAMAESGGNPNAINLTDSNAQAGHPSQGIMQTIPSTFAAYALPGHGNILNPVDNIIAGIRYIMSRYGDVFHVPGIVNMANGGPYIGYANGTGYAQGGLAMVGERGPELMYVPRGAQITPNSQLNSLQGGTVVHVHNYIDGKEITDNTANRIVKSSRGIGPIR